MKRMTRFVGAPHLAGIVLAALGLLVALPAISAASPDDAGWARAPGDGGNGGQADIVGAWRVEAYVLRDGPQHPVDGTILFTESSWSVLFFILDADSNPRRGSGEGGTYSLDGDRLTFHHRYNLSGGGEMKGYPAAELTLRNRSVDEAVEEACTIELSGDRLTIHFPSGNRMTFSRSSR